MFRVAQHDKSRQLFLFLKLDLLAEELGLRAFFVRSPTTVAESLSFFWDNLVVDAPQSQVLAIVRQFPNDVSILAIARVEVLDSSRKVCPRRRSGRRETRSPS